MQFTLDNTEYNADDLNEAGKHAIGQLAAIAAERAQLQLRLEHLAILDAAYTDLVKQNLPKEQETPAAP